MTERDSPTARGTRFPSGYFTALSSEGVGVSDQLRKLIQIGNALSQTRDLQTLLGKILLEARRFTRAQAGTLYIREERQLRFTCVQNETVPSESFTAEPGAGPLIPITRTSLAGYVAETGLLLNLPDVNALPASAEYHFNHAYDLQTGFCSVSMLVVPMVEPGGENVGVIQLINARDPDGTVCTFPSGIEDVVLSLASQAAVAVENALLTRAMKAAWEETIFRLARAAEYRDTDTGAHLQRMSQYSFEIATALGLPPETCSSIRLAAPMHDIGKIGVPDAILLKPGRLDIEEFVLMQRHAAYGADILSGSQVPLLMVSEKIAHTHHEKWDGSGYPRALRRAEIPVEGRIVALADVFDALCSKRCYKAAMTPEQAAEIIRKSSGSHFDPAVVEAFLSVWDRILEVKARHEDQAEDNAKAPLPALG